jgi:hypothetical protein
MTNKNLNNINMKKLLIIAICGFSLSNGFSQVRAIGGTPLAVTTSSAFLDASSNSTYSTSVNSGKGIVFPRVDLTSFNAFLGVNGSASSFRTRYDGFIVYNTASSGVAGVGTTQGTLTPGFWYYDNSSAGVGVGTIAGGTWKPLGSGAAGSVKDITATEVVLDTKIDGAQLYAIKGTFTASGTSAAVTIAKPTGMTGYYSLTTYKDGKTFRNQIISFDTVATTDNVVTGNGFMTEAYPAGSYNYVLEYFK